MSVLQALVVACASTAGAIIAGLAGEALWVAFAVGCLVGLAIHAAWEESGL